MEDEHGTPLDEIDRTLLRLLAEDPRAPYTELHEQLKDEGYEMTNEGIRYRISKLYESTSMLLLTTPKEHGWENLRMFITTTGDSGAKERTFEKLAEMDIWIICRGFGSFDIYANATIPSSDKAERLISQVEELDEVADVDFFLETDRLTNMDRYLSI